MQARLRLGHVQEALVLERQHLQAQLAREEAAAAAAKGSQAATGPQASGAADTAKPADTSEAGGTAADDSLDAFMSGMDRQVEVDKVCLFLQCTGRIASVCLVLAAAATFGGSVCLSRALTHVHRHPSHLLTRGLAPGAQDGALPSLP